MSQRRPTGAPRRGPSLSRRAFLGGAGTLLALPLFESVTPTLARASTATQASPTRLVVYFVPNGIHMADFTPQTVGPDWEVTPILLPMDRHREEIHILSGLANLAASPLTSAPHTHATGTILTCTPIAELEGGQVHNGVSMDQRIAEAIGFNTRFPSLEVGTVSYNQPVGVCEEGYSCAYLDSLAWKGAKSPLPKINDPKVLFDRLFEEFSVKIIADRRDVAVLRLAKHVACASKLQIVLRNFEAVAEI